MPQRTAQSETPVDVVDKRPPILLGANVSVAKTGLLAAVEETIEYDANTFMIYTRSNRGGKARPITEFHRDEALALMKEHNIVDPVVHLSYLVNLASKKQ